MKHIFLLISIVTSINLIAQKEITSSSKIKDVTVFLSGAEIHRKASVSLYSGGNLVTFDNLSPFIVANSIQVKAKNNEVTIVSVNHQNNYLSDNKNDVRLDQIKDSIADIDFKKSLREGHKRVYVEEKSLLAINKSIGGNNTGVNIEDLMDISDWYRERMLEIETKLNDIDRQLDRFNKERARLVNQQRELSKGTVKNTKEIIVNVSSKKTTKVDFEITYVMTRASWIPKYDLRSNDIAMPVTMDYKADVYNAGGHDWEDVMITLSTGNPSIDNTQPELTPWYLQYYEKQKNYKGAYGYGEVSKKSASPTSRNNRFDDSNTEGERLETFETLQEEESSITLASFTNTVESNVNTQFEINFPYTIKSDGQPNLVEIKNHELPVVYRYMSIPKKDGDAFLLARISGWGSYNLLPGEANIYFEGTYVGHSLLETASTKDTLDVSMGRDKGIVVDRKKVDEFCKNSTFGSNKKTTRAYEIDIRNNKSRSIDIVIYDQIPLTSYKEVEVELIEQNGAEYNEKTGQLKWTIRLEAGSSKKLSFKFEVKYPKDYNLNNL
jgi:uncharacterized protein (TIGR02231 family)